MLELTAPQMTVLVGGLRALGVGNSHGIFTDRVGTGRSSMRGAPSPSRSGMARPPIRCRGGSAGTDAFTPSYLMS